MASKLVIILALFAIIAVGVQATPVPEDAKAPEAPMMELCPINSPGLDCERKLWKEYKAMKQAGTLPKL